MKVLIITDLEGVAGVVNFSTQVYDYTKYYEQAKILLTEEVNAVVEGLLERNITDILVADYHGPGGICFEKLHPEAKLIHGRPLAPLKILRREFAKYDICMLIGQHAMAGIQEANLNHTQMSRKIDYYKLNGKYIGEIALVGLHFGALGLPLIYLTGDDAACREAQDLIEGITTVSVKTGLSRSCAITVSKEKSRKLIKEGAIKAIDNHINKPIKPLVWKGPFTLEKRYFTSEMADEYCKDRWERIDGQTIRLTLDNILDILYA